MPTHSSNCYVMFLLYTLIRMVSHLLEANQNLHNRVLIPICNNMLVVQWLYLFQPMSIAIFFKITDRGCLAFLTFKVLNFWKFTSYCSLKPLWSGMGEVVPARTSLTLHPQFPIHSHCASIVVTSTVRVNPNVESNVCTVCFVYCFEPLTGYCCAGTIITEKITRYARLFF